MLEPSWVGRRVSVRRALPTPHPDPARAGRPVFGDVVGDLAFLSAAQAVVETRRGPVEIDLVTVAMARLVPASTRDELELEAVAAAGWNAAESVELGGWLLRADGGFTLRANSVLPLRAPGVDLDQALRRAGSWYADRNLPLRIAVPVEARRLLDAELGERGWDFGPDMAVLVRGLQAVAVGLPSRARNGAEVRLSPRPSDEWISVYRNGAAGAPSARALLTRHERVVFAEIHVADAVVAVGRAVLDDGWLGISAVEVSPAHRRSGLATVLVRALIGWGRSAGALRSYAQVDGRNDPALALWQALGFWRHHAYRYRTAPRSNSAA